METTLNAANPETGFSPEQSPKPHRTKRPWRRAYFRCLAKHGNSDRAAREAGVHPRYVKHLKATDEAFRKRVHAALKDADSYIVGAAEDALYQRGVEGVETPITKDGKLVGYTTKYSDKCLEMLLKARRPKRYDRHKQVQTSGQQPLISVEIRQQILANPDAMLNACNVVATLTRPSIQSSESQLPG